MERTRQKGSLSIRVNRRQEHEKKKGKEQWKKSSSHVGMPEVKFVELTSSADYNPTFACEFPIGRIEAVDVP